MAKETCIMCGAETPYDIQTHIDYRIGYVEGAGQLCSDCYTEKNTIRIPRNMVRETPNDQELGEKIRERYWQTHGGNYADLETYRRGRSKH